MADCEKDTSGGWMIFRQYSNLQEAEIDKGLLEENGIPCVMQNEAIASVYPMTETWASLNLMIPRGFADDARQLLG